jgi:hypothetical protein
VTLPEALYRRLDALAREAGLPVAWLVAALVAELADHGLAA